MSIYRVILIILLFLAFTMGAFALAERGGISFWKAVPIAALLIVVRLGFESVGYAIQERYSKETSRNPSYIIPPRK